MTLAECFLEAIDALPVDVRAQVMREVQRVVRKNRKALVAHMVQTISSAREQWFDPWQDAD